MRYELCLVLRNAPHALTLAEIVDRIQADGFTLGPVPNKVVSDALRWEVQRGRACRVRRGVYGCGYLPRSSESMMRTRIRQVRAAMADDTLAWP